MPAQALLTATIETAINQVLLLDPDSAARLQPLNGKRLTVFLDNTPVTLTLVFSQRIDVLAETRDFTQVVAELDAQSCCVKTSLDQLPALQQSSKLTSLIQEGKLFVEGELNVAQQVSQLFQGLDIDWEEHLSRYTGDVVAHNIFASVRSVNQSLGRLFDNAKAGLANALTEEKDIAVPAIAVAHFSDQVSDLRDDAERFAARLTQLEQAIASKNSRQ